MISRSDAAKSAVLLAALAALASCGGGGGGSGPTTAASGDPAPRVPTTALSLNSSNAQDVAAGATLTGLGTASVSTQFQNAIRVQPLLPRTHLLSRFLTQQIDRLTQGLRSRPPLLVGAAATTTPCKIGGSITFNQEATSATETFSACSDEAGSSVDGTITIDNMALDSGVSFSGTAGLNLTFKQTGFADVNITGSNVSALETVNVSVNQVTLTGSQIFVSTGAVTERLGNFTFMATIDASTETDTITFNYASTKIGGSVNVTTPTPCVTDLTKNFPNAGVFSLSGTGGSKIQVTVNGDESFTTSTQVKIEVDANGDGTFESTIDKNWADLSV